MYIDGFRFQPIVVRPLHDDEQADLFGSDDLPTVTKPPSPPPESVWQPIDNSTPHDRDILVTQKGTRRRAIARWAPEVAAPSSGGWWLMLSGGTWGPTHWTHLPSPLIAIVATGCLMCLFHA